MILCPKCKTRTNVYDSRISYEGYTRRKRICPSCQNRFATIEVLDEDRVLTAKPGKPPKPKKEKPPRPVKTRPPKGQRLRVEKRQKNAETLDSYQAEAWEDDFRDVARELGIEGFDRYD